MMSRSGFLLFLLFLFLTFWIPGIESCATSDSVKAEWDHKEAWDQSSVDYRSPPATKITEWKADRRFQYERDKDGPGFWDYLLSRVFHWLFSSTGDMSWSFYVILIVAGLLVLFVLLRWLDVPVSGLFVMSRRRDDSTLLFDEDKNDYSPSKLREMLRMYRNNGAYREAVRVMFLLYLKELHEQGLITIRRFKTNYDYYYEIPNSGEKEKFKKRMRLFDIVWYGHVTLSSSQYGEIEKAFVNSGEGRSWS